MTDRNKLNEVFGDPTKDRAVFEKRNMVVWNCQKEFATLPFKRMYVNYHILPKLQVTFKVLQHMGLLHEIKSFGGCWNVRLIRGSKSMLSIHSWGLAVDFNVDHNPLGWDSAKCFKMGLTPFTDAFFEVWRRTGWTCGIDFTRPDGMHFEWTKEFEKQTPTD